MADDRRGKEARKRNLLNLQDHTFGQTRFQQDRYLEEGSDAKGRLSKARRYGGRPFFTLEADIEVTGLASESVFNPSRLAWERDVSTFAQRTAGLSGAEKIRVARELEFFKYFQEVGLAQLAVRGGPFDKKSLTARALTHRKGFSATGPRRQDVGQHGYTIWSQRLDDSESELLRKLGRDVRMSKFGVETGIYGRSIRAFKEGTALTEPEAVLEFVRGLSEKNYSGKVARLVGHNVWFDVMGMQSFAIKHAEQVMEQGLDPFLLMNKYWENNFVVDSTEEYFFDVLRAKGLRDEKFAKKFLKFGKMANHLFPEEHGFLPGLNIGLDKDVLRRQQGQQSFLRARTGWKLELLDEIFFRYAHLTEEELGMPFRQFKKLNAHDALYDVAVSKALSGRFQKAHKLFDVFEKMQTPRPHHMPESWKAGKLAFEHVEALSFARAGFLGGHLEGKKITDHAEFARWLLTDDAKLRSAHARTRSLWRAWTGATEKSMRQAEAARKAYLAGSLSSTAPWGGSQMGRNLTLGINRLKSRIPGGRGGAVLAVAGAAFAGAASYMAFGWQQPDRIQTNIPPTYEPGMRGQSRGVDVPWASPWQGMEQDESAASTLMDRAAWVTGGVAAWYATKHGIPGALRKWSPKGFGALYFGTQALEEAMPFRIGRIFGLSAQLSSFAGTGAGDAPIRMATKYLRAGSGLSAMGKIYARGLGASYDEFAKSISALDDIEFTRVRNKLGMPTAFHEIALPGLGRRQARFFGATTYLGKGFAATAAEAGDVLSAIPPWRVRGRIESWFAPKPLEGRVSRLFKRGFEWLYRGDGSADALRRRSVVRSYLENYARIPQWDTNILNQFIRWNRPVDELLIPGYERPTAALTRALKHRDFRAVKSAMRFAGGMGLVSFRSAQGLMRSQAALFGKRMMPANTFRALGKQFVKTGAYTFGAWAGFNVLNDTLGGALTAPFWNVRDRLDILHSQVSEFLGFTEIKKRHPGVGTFAAAGWAALPFVALGVSSYLRRVGVPGAQDLRRGNLRVGMVKDFSDRWKAFYRGGGEFSWQVGHFRSRGEQAFQRYHKPMVPGRTRTGVRWMQRLTKKVGGARRLNLFGKIGAAAWAASSLLFMPFLGSSETVEEVKDKLAGRTKVEIRKGRFWEFGSTPYEGGKTSYYRYHQSVRRRVRATREAPGEGRGLGSVLKDIVNPYWREEEAYYTRPYPITGEARVLGQPMSDIPFIGTILAGTIGKFIKPPKLMHTEEWRTGQPYAPYGPDVEPSPALGGEQAPAPIKPLGWQAQVRDISYRATELAGLRGFLTQSIIFRKAFGGNVPFEHTPVLAQPNFGSLTDRFYEGELGGMGGLNEFFRRLYPRPERGLEVNPLRNQMPRWMPGEEYFINFKEGDPYAKIPMGEERLPGEGFAAYHPSLKGVRPEEYPAWARYEVLADVAPWSKEYRIWRGMAFKEARQNRDAQMLARLQDIEEQVEAVKTRKRFNEYSFLEETDRVTGRVTQVMPGGQFTLAEYPHHTFTLAGANLSLNKVAQHLRNENSWTKEKATQVAYAQQELATRHMEDLMVGNRVRMEIHRGGLSRPDVEAEVFVGGRAVAPELVEAGLAAPEAGRYTAGPVGRLYGRAVEALTHLPQQVPGPFFLNSKLSNEVTAIEAYKRDQLYGSEFRFWDKPYENFIRTYAYQAVAKLTPGEFVPPHVRKKRELDMLYDRMEFLKQVQAGNTYKAGRTAAGMNVYGAEQSVRAAMTYRDRPYFDAFTQETDPKKREQILSMVSGDMQRALVGQWTRQYNQAIGQRVSATDARARIAAAADLAVLEVGKAGYQVPGKNWVGWHPQVDMKDVQAVHLQQEGIDHHDFNIWDDRMQTLHRKPYLRGSHEHLMSRPMQHDAHTIGSAVDQRHYSPQMTQASIHLSRSLTASVNVQHRVDYTGSEREQYFRAREALIA